MPSCTMDDRPMPVPHVVYDPPAAEHHLADGETVVYDLQPESKPTHLKWSELPKVDWVWLIQCWRRGDEVLFSLDGTITWRLVVLDVSPAQGDPIGPVRVGVDCQGEPIRTGA
jgi:hypothetical protein